MIEESSRAKDIRATREIAEQLARETNTPVEQVEEIFANESAELERTARVKTYIRVLTTQRVRMLLHARVANP